MSLLSDFRLVLVAPVYALNVGSCMRACANFELRDIRVVEPKCKWQGSEAQQYAKGPAAEFLAGAVECETVLAAVKGCTVVVGFTRRTGELRQPSITLGELAELKSAGKTALVFGREADGLTHEELLSCTHICTLTTGQHMPSLNLSHAVAVVLARLFEGHPSEPAPAITESAKVDELEVLFEHWSSTLNDAGIVDAENPGRMMTHIRRLLQRAQLTTRDIGILRAFLSKVQVALGTRNNRRKNE